MPSLSKSFRCRWEHRLVVSMVIYHLFQASLAYWLNLEHQDYLTLANKYYPKIDKVLGLGVLYPTLEDIAEGIAKRDKARIVPTGIYALNRLGFSTQIPMNIVYLTDGSERKLNLSNGTSIQFKYTAPKNLAFKSQLAMLLTFAFKTIGKANVTQEILAHTKELLAKDDKNVIEQDYKLMPAWVSSIVKSLYAEE